MFLGEVLSETQGSGYNPVKGIKRAVETRKYGTPEQRSYAYQGLFSSLSHFFSTYRESIVQTKDPSIERIPVNWRGYTKASIEKREDGFRLHLTASSVNLIDTGAGETKQKVEQTVINITPERGDIDEWTDTTVRPDNSYTNNPAWVAESKFKTSTLSASNAFELASSLHDQSIVKPAIISH